MLRKIGGSSIVFPYRIAASRIAGGDVGRSPNNRAAELIRVCAARGTEPHRSAAPHTSALHQHTMFTLP